MEGGNRWRERWVAASQRRCLLIVAVFALQVHGQAQPTHPQDAGIAAPPRTSNLATRAGQQNGGRTGFAARRLAEAEEEGDGRGASASEGFLESCAWLDALPRDFSSATDVNLDRYGGKQDEDGGVDLHGMQFRVPEPGASGERIVTAKIKVRVPSVLKIKCLSPTPGVSCDVRVAEGDGSDSYGLLHVGGAAAGTVLLPLLNPVTSGRRHVIRLVFSVPAGTKKGACLPFEFQSVMRPASSVRDELRCPPTLPVPALPQRKFSVGSEGTGLHFASDQFMITPDMLKLYKRSDASFVYPMSLHVKTGEVMLSVQASFDWILGDISVELARIRDDDLAGSDGHILFKSNETESEDQNAQFEKTTKLLATVPAGKYRLLIRDKTTSALRAGVVAAPTLSEEGAGDQEANRKLCVRFAFNIDAEPSGSMHLAPATPHNEKLLVPPDQPDGVHENRAVLLAVEPATAQNLDPTQPLRMVLSFSTPLAIFGKDGDGTPDAGRGGEEGTTEVHCSSGGGRRSWVGSSLCSTVFTLQPSGVNQQREPLGVAGHLGTSSRSNGPRRTSLTPATVYLRAGNSAQVVITWSAASLVEGVEYVLHIQQDYLKTQEGARVSVGAHNGGVHMYRAAACNCHGHGRCDVERRCACAAGYAGDDCQRCSEGNSLNDQGVCEKVKSTLVCSRNSCNGHGSCLMPSSGVTCMCAPGYANSKEGQLCGACAEGFEGYPNCKRLASEEFKEREDEAGGAVDGCSLPALPRDLNGRGMLESDAQSSLHLQGDYWLDVRSRRHIMHVAISRPSVLHLRVDLGALAGALGVAVAIERLASSGGSPQADMQLPIKGADDSSKAGGNRGSLVWQSLASVEDGGRMASGEGFLEAVLLPMKSNGPNPSSSAIASSLRYRIILAYEVLGELHTDKEDALCRSLGLQLGITPLDELKKLASQVDVTCPSNVAGRIDIPEHYDVSPTGWSKNGTFYIATAEPGTRVMRKGKAIQPISIRIPEVAGKVARLSAVVGYRFEMSSVGLLLEAERPDVSGARDKPRCEAMVKPNKGEDKKDWGAESIIHGSGEAKTQSNGAAKKDEWADWNNIGKKTGYGEPSKAYYGNEPRERAQGRTGNAFADDDEDDDDDDRKSEGKRHSADRDGAYDFHDLINSALSGLAQGGHGGPGHLTGGFPGLGSLPGGVHVIHMPFSHGAGRGGAAGGGGSFVGGDPDADVNQIPKHIADMFKNHPFPGAWGDDDEDDDTDDLDDDDDDDDDDDWGNRRRRALLSIYDGGGSVVASSTPAASDVLVERSEEDEAPAGKISVATMLRKPVAGSEEMFDCRSGRERYNHNVIDESLPPGTYTLWLVRDSDFDEVLRGRADDASAEGDEVNMRCLAFDLAMSVTFEDPPPTPVTCTARTLPAALHEPGFLGPTGTRVHIQDTFYMRQARLSRRHFIDFTVRGQGPSVLRAHVESLESVDIRLSVFKLERTAGSDKSKATIVDVETPHVVGGLRGDAILSLLPPGSYKLQLEFLNPGGAPGFPKWDLGEASNGQGRQGGGRDGCEVLDLEIALSPLEDLGSDGWKQDCPGKGNGVDRVPSLQDMTGGRQTALHIGDSFNVPAADGGSAPGESMLQRLREDREPLFWAQTRNGSRGYVIASYPLEVEALAVLRAGLRSDFVHDDLVLDVVDAAGRLVFTGAHRRSYNHIQSLLQPGRYTVKLRQSMSAAEVLASKTNDKWIQKTDAKGKTYFFNTVSQTSQWHRPPVMAGSDCARFSFWIALDPFAAADDCHVAADAMSVPASLDGPGMLGSHNRAYLQGVFSIGGQQGLAPTSEGNSMSQTIRFTVTRPSRIRAVVVPLPDELGNSVLTELTLHSIAPLTEKEENEGVAKLVEQVARGEFLSSSFYEHDKYDEASASQGTQGISLGSRQILTAVISPEDEHESAEKQQQRQQDGGAVSAPRHFVLRLRHMLPPVQDFKCTKFSLLISVEPIPEAADPDAAAEGDDGSSCAGVTESKWPQISEDLTGLFACQDSSGDANFKCWQDLHGMRVMQSSKPARNRFAINLDKTSHLRIEIGFPLYSAPLLASIVPLGCPDGAGPCASSGAEGKDEIAPLVSADRPGSSLLVARWLPRGRYLVTLAQAARKIGADDPDADDGNVEGAGAGAGKARTVCERFSFRMVLEKASGASASENHLGQHVQRLPLSLDGVPFLKFGGKAHLWGRYAMAHPGLATQEMFFSLKKESMIRIDAMPQLGAGHVSLAVFRLGDLGEGKLGASPATELSPLNAELPPALQRADVLVQAKEGRYKVVVAFEPSDWSLHPPSRGRVRGSFTMQLAINPTQQSSLDSESVDSNAGESTCEDSALEARQGDGPFHLFAAHGSFSNKDRRGSLIKVVPLTTRQESVVRVTVQADFASAALYTVLSPSPASSGSSKDTRKSTGAKSSWVCKPGYNSCQLDAVVAAGEYTLAFYQPSAQSSDAKPAAATCVKFSLRIQMHPTSLKYGMGCHGARQVPADLSPLAVTDTTRDSSGKSKYRAALTWAHAALLVSEADAGQVQVKDTMLVSLPASFAKDSYLLHVRHRDARPHSQIEVTPFTSFAATGMSRSEGAEAPQSGVSVIHQGEEGGWETLFKTSHLSVDQESLFIFRGSRSGAPAGAAVTLGVRVSSTLAFRHEPCPTWGLSVNLQKEAHVRRAMQCPPGAGTSLPQTELALNAAGFGFEELDTLAPIATWPPKDSNCAQDGVEPEGSRCGHTADTTLTLSAASLIQASLGFDGAAVSYTLVLMALNADSTSVIATSALIFRTEDTLSKSRAGGTSSIPPLSSLTRISLSQEVPQGKYVLRISRKNSLSSTSSESSSQESLCSPLLWRVAVSPLSVGEGTQAADGESMEQRPFVLDLDPPGLHKVPKSIAEVSVRLSFSEPLAPGRSAGGIHVCPKDSVPSDVWLQDAVKGGGGGLMSGAGGGCFAVSWMQEESKDGQELDGEAKGWEVHIGIATANMMVGTRYVLWFKGTDWPRGALSGLRLLQPPPFSFSVAAQDCSGHGTLASDGSCDCDSSRAGYLCGACDPSVAPKECDVAAVPLDDAHTGASSTSAAGSLAAATTSEAGAATQAKTSSQTKTTSPLAATHMSAGTDNEGKAGPVNLATGDAGVQDGKVKDRVKVPAVQGVVGDADDKKYSKRIRDDGAVDADSVVDLDSPKMSEQKSRTAAAKESLAPTDKKTAGAAGESSENGKAARKRHIICQLIGCGKNSAWALAGVSGLLALVGFSIGIVTCLYRRRRSRFSYGRVRMEDDL